MMRKVSGRMYFHEGGGPDCVINFGKYEGQTFAAVCLKDRSYVEWAVKQDKCRTWKLKAFKYFVPRLCDLERVMKREKKPEERNRVARAECLVEEMAQEEMKIVENIEFGGRTWTRTWRWNVLLPSRSERSKGGRIGVASWRWRKKESRKERRFRMLKWRR